MEKQTINTSKNCGEKVPSKYSMYQLMRYIINYNIIEWEIAINKVSLAEYTEENEKGLIFVVDLEYPQNYTMVTMTTRLPPENSVFLKICFQIIVKK